MESQPTPEWPPVSVFMPVLNEEKHLRAAVERVLAQGYPGELEVVMAVGPSTDATERIAAELASEHSEVRVVPNPTGKTPSGLNRAIEASSHDILIRVDGHGELADDYIRIAVETLLETGAANVGGLMDAQGVSLFEQAVAAAYNSRLGLGGNAFHLAETPAGPAETVFLGVFRRDALTGVGGFDEEMFRAQDWELNYRLRQAGETVWFNPALRVLYRPRSDVVSLAKQFYNTGKWRRAVIARYPETANVRYLMPPATVVGVSFGKAAGLAGLITGNRLLKLGWMAPLVYLGFLGYAAVSTQRLPLAVRLRLPFVLAVMHMAWGMGFLVGLPSGQRPGR